MGCCKDEEGKTCGCAHGEEKEEKKEIEETEEKEHHHCGCGGH